MAQAADQHRALAMVERVVFGLGDRVGLGCFRWRTLGQRVGYQRERLPVASASGAASRLRRAVCVRSRAVQKARAWRIMLAHCAVHFRTAVRSLG